MKYLSKKNFIIEAETSKSTLYKFYKKHPEHWDETKLVSNRRLIPTTHIKYFSSKEMREECKRKETKVEELKSFLDHIRNSQPDDFRMTLWRSDWDIFGTISYKNETTRDGCRNKMSNLFKHLKHHYEHKTNLRMFFNTEEYDVRGGYHNHFIMHCSKKAVLNTVTNSIKTFFSSDRVDIQDYDHYQVGAFYICKDGLDHDSWDDWEF